MSKSTSITIIIYAFKTANVFAACIHFAIMINLLLTDDMQLSDQHDVENVFYSVM